MDHIMPVSPQRIEFALELASLSGAVVRRYFRTGVAVDRKSDSTPVTLADREAERVMRAAIEAAFPEDGITGEEFGETPSRSGLRWVLDPIDGTKAFVAGRPTFGTLIALCEGDRPVLGIIHQPVLGELWLGVDGRPTLFNDEPARVRPCAGLADAIVSTTSPDLFTPPEHAAWERIRARAGTKIYGGDCYAYGLVASGHADLVIESGLKPHDVAALLPVLKGAGGVVTDWSGRAVVLAPETGLVAAGDARVHAEALAILAEIG
jgi:histidinol phosphatase-like enzyme (inositol monophosphatase family)